MSTACGPSVATLAREKRYQELVCAPSNEKELAAAGEALVGAVDVRYHVVEVTRANIEKPTPAFDAILAKKRFFGVALELHQTDLATTISPTVTGADGSPLVAARPELIAAAVGETLPADKVTTSPSVSVDTNQATWSLLTLGASRLFSNKPAVTVGTTTSVTKATGADVEREAPRTFEVLLAVNKHADEHKYHWFVIDRGAAVNIGYELKLFRSELPCVIRVSHGGEPLVFDHPTGPLSWRGWKTLDFTRGSDVIKATHDG